FALANFVKQRKALGFEFRDRDFLHDNPLRTQLNYSHFKGLKCTLCVGFAAQLAICNQQDVFFLFQFAFIRVDSRLNLYLRLSGVNLRLVLALLYDAAALLSPIPYRFNFRYSVARLMPSIFPASALSPFACSNTR